MLKKLMFLAAATALLLTVGAAAAQSQTVVIAHPGVPGDSVAAGDLQKIFLGKTGSWSDGTAAKPALPASGDAVDAFLKDVVKKSSSQFKTFWKKAVFSGTGTPPEEFATEAELVAYVASTPGAVGVVAAGTDTGAAKVLAVQ